MTDAADTDLNNALRLAKAAAWRTRLHEVNAEGSQAFEDWLAEDPANEAAWRQVQEPWSVFAEQASSPALIELRRSALGRARSAQRKGWLFRGGSVQARAKFAAIAAVLAMVALGVGDWYISQLGVYRTEMGERRVVTLEDGSKISLDANSAVKVQYTENAREVILRQGQARFDVAKIVGRPFSVLAGDRKVVATGTSFNVDLFGTTLLVTLIEGGIAVLEQGGLPIKDRELAVGQQLVIAPAQPIEVKDVDLAKTTAWEQGRLVFDNEVLASVAMRVSRYSEQPIRIDDPRVREMRISGVFNTGDVAGFVSTITTYLPVRADAQPDGSIELLGI